MLSCKRGQNPLDKYCQTRRAGRDAQKRAWPRTRPLYSEWYLFLRFEKPLQRTPSFSLHWLCEWRDDRSDHGMSSIQNNNLLLWCFVSLTYSRNWSTIVHRQELLYWRIHPWKLLEIKRNGCTFASLSIQQAHERKAFPICRTKEVYVDTNERKHRWILEEYDWW